MCVRGYHVYRGKFARNIEKSRMYGMLATLTSVHYLLFRNFCAFVTVHVSEKTPSTWLQCNLYSTGLKRYKGHEVGTSQ